MRHLFTLAILLMSAGVWAQDTTANKPDARLSQEVTLEVSHAKLEDVCRQLTEMTGVTIKAGSGERDWKVRERKVTIQAKDMKIGTLMQEISKLLGFYLSRSGKEGEWAYLYWQDMKGRTLETEMLNAEKEAAAQRLTEKRRATLDAAQRALKMTPEEIEKVKKTDPLTAYMAGTKSGRAFAQLLSALATQLPTERELMLRGKRVTIPIDGLPGYLQQAAMDTSAGGIAASEAKKRGKDFPGDLAPYQVVIVPIDRNTEYEAGVLGIAGAIVVNGLGSDGLAGAGMGEFGVGEPMGLFILGQPDSPIGKLFGESLQAIDDGQNFDEVGKRLNEVASSPEFLAESTAKDSATEKEPPTDPRLTREVEITEEIPVLSLSDRQPVDEAMAKTLTVVSEAIGMPVLLESFARLVPPGGHIRKGKQPLYKILIGFEKCGYAWDLSEDALRVRPRDWALRRSYEIPETYLARYRAILDKNGEFSLGDVASIAAELTDEQISNTLMANPDFGEILSITMRGEMGSTGPMLRLYNSFTPQQKAALASQEGLSFAQLTGDQWSVLGDMITDRLGGVYVLGGNVVHKPVPLDETNNMAQDNFEITVMVADQREPSVVKERILRWRKGQVESFQNARAKAEEQRKKAAEEQKEMESR